MYMGQEFKDRLRVIRKSLPQKTSQEVFAKSLGLTRTAYNKYELGLVIPSDTFIQLVCSKFNISEEWLRTGEGEMRQESETAMFSSFARQYNLSEREQHVARYLLSLSSEERQQILHYLDGIARAMHTCDDVAVPVADTSANTKRGAPMTTEEIEAEVNVFREALIAEQKGQSVSTSGSSAAKMA